MNTPPARALFYFGASHHQTPIELRERLALTEDRWQELAPQLFADNAASEFVALNTCNRVEFYGVASPGAWRGLAERFFALQGFTAEESAKILREAVGAEVLRHLITVAAGLESQMLGETEILGQVKDAYAAAQARRSVGPILNRAFQKTFQHAKYVRTHTAITEGQISVSNVAVDLATKIFGRLDEVRILLLGAGEIGEKTARAFQSRGAPPTTISSRTLERAMDLARIGGGAAIPWENFEAHLAHFDIVVCSTASPTAVVTRAAVEHALRARPSQPLFFIDLALPRDVEPDVGEIENVFVYNLDDLAKIAEENRAAREAEIGRAKALIAERSAALWAQIEPLLSRG